MLIFTVFLLHIPGEQGMHPGASELYAKSHDF